MAKDSHTGKNPRQQQQYFEVVNRHSDSPTVEDDEFGASTADSDVSLGYQEDVPTQPSPRRKRKKSGLNQHLKKHLATYLVGIIFGLGTIAVTLYLTLGLPMYGDIQKISNQIEIQKELNNSLIEDLEELEDNIIFGNSQIQSKLQEINLKLQEQAMKLEFLAQLVKEFQP